MYLLVCCSFDDEVAPVLDFEEVEFVEVHFAAVFVISLACGVRLISIAPFLLLFFFLRLELIVAEI